MFLKGIGGLGERSLQVFENELKQVIIPFVEKNYKAETSPGGRALAGLSMGGLQTLATQPIGPSFCDRYKGRVKSGGKNG